MMTQPFDDPTRPASLHHPREALEALGVHLASHGSTHVSMTDVQRAVDEALHEHGPPTEQDWPTLVEGLVRHLGLRISWRVCSWDRVRDDIQPALPAVTWDPSGWRVVSRRGARLREQRFPGAPTPHRLDPKTLPEQELAWGLVEDSLPGTMLSAPPGTRPFTRMMGLLRAEREDLMLVLVFAGSAGGLGLAIPVAVQVLVNTVAFGAFRQPVVALSLMLFACLAVAAMLRGLQRYVIETLQRRVFVRMVADLSVRLPRVRLKAWDAAHGPELVNRFFDVLTVQKSMSSLLLDGLSSTLQALVGMVLLALYHPALLGFDVALLASIVGLVWILGRGAEDTAVVESKRKYAVAGWLEEIADNPTLYKLGGGSALAARRADALSRSWLDARATHFRIFFRQFGGALALQAVANAALLTIGGWLVIDGQLTIGQLVAAEFIVASVLIGFAKFSEKLETFYDLLAAVDKLGQLVDLPLDRHHGRTAPTSPEPMSISLRGIGGQWPHGKLQNISMHVAPRARTLILGQDDWAHTMLADTILGMRSAQQGHIELDGTDVDDVRADTLRERVALVRGTHCVSGTIVDNVALGRPNIGSRDVDKALAAVGLDAALRRYDSGQDITLLPHGTPLHPDDRARVAVARAIVGRPRLIVVDGLLDHVSRTVQRALLDALLAPDRSWTLLVLSRDEGLARRFDQTLLVAHGTLAPYTGSKP